MNENDLKIKKAISESKQMMVDPYSKNISHSKTEKTEVLEALIPKKSLNIGFNENAVEGSEPLFSETEEEKELRQYINANYINGLVRNFSEKSFIACQAPLEKTYTKFWQMIWENKVNLIIMVCPLKGPKREEATCYWGNINENEQIGMTTIFKDKDIPVFELRLKEKINLSDTLVLRRLVLTLCKDSISEKSTNTGPFE